MDDKELKYLDGVIERSRERRMTMFGNQKTAAAEAAEMVLVSYAKRFVAQIRALRGVVDEPSPIKLVDVYKIDSVRVLYNFLEMRLKEKHGNISHTKMPTYEDHCAFYCRKPYKGWYLIDNGIYFLGAIYLSKQNEIGIFILPEARGNGYANLAIEMLMKAHPEKQYLANINPNNMPSIRLFEKLGFTQLQVTYAKSS